jgi:TonB-linked SusC/RagA family outer membrane protein
MRAVWASVLFALALGTPAYGQQGQTVVVSGTVSALEGGPLPGVTVMVMGTALRTLTAANGRYVIPNAPSDGTLIFAVIGRKRVTQPISGRTTIDVTMERAVANLDTIRVSTGYTEQRRGDITGAIATVPVEQINRETGSSVLQRLGAAVPGVTVEASGSPGARSTVRIRGISSFQNNDPLYVVDGTPVQDSYINWLNPEDITSITVLKDASAASIYGSRASNGVIVIETTKRGLQGPARTTLRLRTGVATPTNGYDQMLITNSLDYFQVVKASYQNAGLAVPTNIYGSVTNPVVPAYIFPNNCGPSGAAGVCQSVDVSTYSYPNNLIMPGSQGTNWWKAVFGPAPVTDANLEVAGGSADNTYGVSFNYFNQNGTARYNDYRRGTVRVNTDFRRSKLNFGENLAVGVEQSYGGQANDAFGEGGILGKNILMQPVVPVYDVAGGFASGKANTLGNNTNPLKVAYEARNNLSRNNRVFGNVFGGYAVLPALMVRSRLGFNVGQGEFNGYSPITPENSEASFVNSAFENQSTSLDWTWSNTAQYAASYARNSLNLLVGQEANAGNNRFLTGSINSLLNTSLDARYIQDALGDAKTKNVSSSGGQYALLSYFGKADYTFADKYMLSGTLRKDGSSRLGPNTRWGTFPAFGLGWRLSNEPFFKDNSIVNDAMLRYGWGVTGNQNIPAGRIVSQFGGGTGETFYDIGGNNTSTSPGYRQTSLGNPNLKWEEDRSQNIGTDLSLFNRNLDIVFDGYHRLTDNLLFNPAVPATAGFASPPFVNIGSMQNNGFDFSVGHRSTSWNVTLNGGHYKNKIVKISGQPGEFFSGPVGIRFGNPVINEVGQPIGAFYGLVADGYFRDSADVTAHATQNGAAPGRIKFRDLNGDGKIDQNDRTIIGSPHPKFTSGLDLGFRWRAFDFSSTVFGSFGNKIFDAQKQFYVFRNFSTNVKKDLLANSWTPTHQNAKYPRIDLSDTYSYQISSYYVEDGSYVRMRNMQIGFTIPSDTRWVGRSLAGARIYVQGENLFTITGYEGLDPSLPVQSVFGSAGDIRDQFRGVDQGTYPTNRVISIGLSTQF